MWACSSKGSCHILGPIYHTYKHTINSHKHISRCISYTHELVNEYGTLPTGTPSSLPRISLWHLVKHLRPDSSQRIKKLRKRLKVFQRILLSDLAPAPYSNCYGKVGARNHVPYCMDRKWGSLSALFACSVHVEIWRCPSSLCLVIPLFPNYMVCKYVCRVMVWTRMDVYHHRHIYQRQVRTILMHQLWRWDAPSENHIDSDANT